MSNLKNKTAFVYDHGSYVCVAEELGKDFGTVLYYVPPESPFPKSEVGMIGMGLDGVERVFEVDSIDDVDVIVFPDCIDAGLQNHLRSLNRPVWGSGYSSSLELDRWSFHQSLNAKGLNTIPCKLLVGVTELEDYIRDREDLYIKTSYFRGDFETFHHINWLTSEPWLDDLCTHLGPRKELIPFVVEDALSGVEVGYDGMHLNGKFNPMGSFGYEVKDAGFLGQVRSFDEIPAPLRTTLTPFSGDLDGYTSAISTEVRIDKKRRPFFTDPCMRFPNPPVAALMRAFDNWPEVIYAAAHGELVELHPTCKYYAVIILRSSWVEKHWLAVHYPKSVENRVSFGNRVIIDGQTYIPSQGYPHFGSVIGLGNTTEEAVKECLSVLDKVDALEIDKSEDALDKAMDSIEEGIEVGIDW